MMNLLLSLLLLASPAGARPERPLQSCLVEAYPDQLLKAEQGWIVWRDGTRMEFGGPRPLDFEQLLADGNLYDQMSQPYPLGEAFVPPPAENDDPGRLRFEPFFKKMYGAGHKEVEARSRRIVWMPSLSGKKVRVTTVNGVDKKLEAVSAELETLAPEIRKIAARIGGGLVWRKIKGTDRLSMHSFGIAVDLAVDISDYWRWARGKNGALTWKNRIPMEIVEVFERHGFIWGGKWYHFDTMHFEYRPELLQPDCLRPLPQARDLPL